MKSNKVLSVCLMGLAELSSFSRASTPFGRSVLFSCCKFHFSCWQMGAFLAGAEELGALWSEVTFRSDLWDTLCLTEHDNTCPSLLPLLEKVPVSDHGELI